MWPNDWDDRTTPEEWREREQDLADEFAYITYVPERADEDEVYL